MDVLDREGGNVRICGVGNCVGERYGFFIH